MTKHFLADIPLFNGLNSQQRRRMVGALRTRNFSAEQVIFNEGDLGDKLYIVREGLVRIYTDDLNKKETSVIMYGQPKSIFGELAILDGQPRSISAQAMEETVVYTMSNRHFKHHLECIPQLSMNLIQQMSYKMRKTTGHIHSLASKPVIARLSILISQLAQEYGVEENNLTTVKFNLNQTQIANMIGATKESTNRALMQLSQFKVLHQDESRIHILDLKTLHSLGG